jgi:lipopolysaccharide export system permease protein
MKLKVYQRNIIKDYLGSLSQVTLVFFSLILILNIFEEINFFKDEDISVLIPILLTFLNAPTVLYEIFPFIFLISTQFFFLKIIENNEIITYKNFGLSNIKIIRLISFTTFLLGILLIFLFYNFSAKLKFLYLDLKNDYAKDNKYLAVITENGLWIKDEINDKINLVNAEQIEKQYLKNVSITQFTSDFNLIQIINSDKVDIANKTWRMEKAKISIRNKQDEIIDSLDFDSNFDQLRINNLFSNLSSLTFWELNELKKDYKALGYSTVNINLHNHKIYSYPFYIMLMTILSSVVMSNIKYNKSRIFNLILGILLSVLIYYINYFFNVFGVNEKIPLIFSIWMPIIILTLIVSIGLVRINEK